MFSKTLKQSITTFCCLLSFMHLACDTEQFVYHEGSINSAGTAGFAGSAGSAGSAGPASAGSDQGSAGASAGSNNAGNTGSNAGSSSTSIAGSTTGGSKGTGGSSSTSAGSPSAPCFSPDLIGIKLEADYILASQIMPSDTADAGYGAIKHKPGTDTLVIPGEVAMAGIGLIQASKALNDSTYKNRALIAAAYLSRIIDPIYGGWHDEYKYASVSKTSLSVRNSALVAIFLYNLGFNSSRTATMKSAGGFVNAHIDLQNKKGADDGLVCKGRDDNGNFISERWLSDNVLAYQAMTMSASWATTDGDMAFATELKTNATKILNGIRKYLYNSTAKSWIRMVNADDTIPTETAATIDWISYSPELFELPTTTIPVANTGTTIHDALQLSSGGVAWDNGNYRARQSPLYSFQAALVWRRAGQCAYANSAMDWAKANTWRLTKDANGLTGGWLDWIETSGNKPNELERSVETSAYAILNWTSFSFAP